MVIFYGSIFLPIRNRKPLTCHKLARVMMFSATFRNISVISCYNVMCDKVCQVTCDRSVVFSGHSDLSQVTDKLYHIRLYWLHFNHVLGGNQTYNCGMITYVVIDVDQIDRSILLRYYLGNDSPLSTKSWYIYY